MENNEIKDYFKNNLYFNVEIKEDEQNIYKKSIFPIIVVYCQDEGQDDCNYYIEMTNDFEKILLNQNRKIYSFIEPEQQHIYKIDLPLNTNKNNNNQKIYIQLYSFTGKTYLNVVEDEFSENNSNYYNYNDNGIYYIKELNNFREFNLEIKGNNTNYSLFYYIINEAEENYIYLPSGEVHYGIINTYKTSYNYIFQDNSNTTQAKYIVSINAINCELRVNDDLERKFQKIINYNESINIYYDINKDFRCDFTISAIEIMTEVKSSKELIFNDRTYHYYEFSSEFNFTSIDYLIPKDEISNKEIFLNINKKSNDSLIINIEGQNKTIYDYNEIINLNKLKNIKEDLNIYHLIITIRPKESIEGNKIIKFKIKINGNKDKYSSYLDPEEIENNIIENEDNFYYEYYYKDNHFNENDNEDEYIEQIFLDCKGSAEFNTENIKLYGNNNLEIVNDNNIDSMAKNYINLKVNKNCQNGCRINFQISLKNNKHKNYYKIYLLSQNEFLTVEKNMNIYGNINTNMVHRFKTDLNKDNEIILNLNCLNCIVEIYSTENENKESLVETLYESKKISTKMPENFLYYKIKIDSSKSKNNNFYYYFSIIISSSPKIIHQSESILCESKCRFILPIYDFYLNTKENILFYVPETEKVVIYYKIMMNDSSHNDLYDFDLKDKSDSNSLKYPITNRLILNKTNLENVYIQIQVENKTKLNIPFNLVVSKFHQYYYDDNQLIYPQNIFTISKNNHSKSEDNEYIIENEGIKSIHLINGSGYFVSGNEKYNLNYESQELISILNDNNLNIIGYSSSEEDFSYYLKIDYKEEFNLLVNKANYLKYYKNNKNGIIKFKIDNIEESKDLYINYYFSKIDNNPTDLINCQEEDFEIYIGGENIVEINKNNDKLKEVPNNNKKIENIYYKGLRRGYIFIDNSYLNEKK